MEKALAEKLRELLGSVSWLGDWKVERNPAAYNWAFDLLAMGKTHQGQSVRLWVDCHLDPRPSQFPYVSINREFENRQLKRVQAQVFAAPFISPRMAKICQEHGWSWFDLAGNCWLSVPGVLHIERRGNDPVHERLRPNANLSTPEAARIIRALLAPVHIACHWHQWELQKACRPKVSIGLVNKMVRHLQDETFIVEKKHGGFGLSDPVGLLTTWCAAYRFDRHQRRGYFTLLQGQQLQKALAKLGTFTGGHAVYAAFSAADFQAPHVRQPKTWLYVDAEHEEKFRDMVEAKQVDSGENIVAIIPDDPVVFYLQENERDDSERLPCTDAVQTYVDLCHVGGRGEEAAEALLEQRLKLDWNRYQRLFETKSPMTIEQWRAIRDFIYSMVRIESPFDISSLALQRRFNLHAYFYAQMMGLGKDDGHHRFSPKHSYGNPDRPGSLFDIEFTRQAGRFMENPFERQEREAGNPASAGKILLLGRLRPSAGRRVPQLNQPR
ncbi:MAG: hypothetical protein HY360_22405 [Verrucomicrobia bacterium]|nr:hypothetical protein [Verrucomicrobiota bacterium]